MANIKGWSEQIRRIRVAAEKVNYKPCSACGGSGCEIDGEKQDEKCWLCEGQGFFYEDPDPSIASQLVEAEMLGDTDAIIDLIGDADHG